MNRLPLQKQFYKPVIIPGSGLGSGYHLKTRFSLQKTVKNPVLDMGTI